MLINQRLRWIISDFLNQVIEIQALEVLRPSMPLDSPLGNAKGNAGFLVAE
jgi:hypothetical protein